MVCSLIPRRTASLKTIFAIITKISAIFVKLKVHRHCSGELSGISGATIIPKTFLTSFHLPLQASDQCNFLATLPLCKKISKNRISPKKWLLLCFCKNSANTMLVKQTPLNEWFQKNAVVYLRNHCIIRNLFPKHFNQS